MTDLIKIDAEDDALTTIAERMGDYAKHSRSDNTWRAYASCWRTFETWCLDNNKSALPSSLETVATYLIGRVDSGCKVATLDLDLAAIRFRHKQAGHELDTGSAAFQAVWGGIRRKHAAPQKRASAFTADDLVALLALPHGQIIDIRDRAMLALGVMGALRGDAELLSLDYKSHGTGRGTLDVTERGVVVTLFTSKSNQTDSTETVIPRVAAPETVAAIELWLSVGGIEPGSPVWRGVDNSGRVLSERAVLRTLSRAVCRSVSRVAVARGMDKAAANKLASGYSSHSLRAGAVTSLALAGVSDSRIMNHSRHRSVNMVARYTRVADAWANSPLKTIGV